MKRTGSDRPVSAAPFSVPSKRARTDQTSTPLPQTPIVAPSMSEKKLLLEKLGSRKEITTGKYSGKLGDIASYWGLPLDLTIKIAGQLKLPSEWKGLMLSGRQGYRSVDAAHPERRFPRLRDDLTKISGRGKAEANDVRRYLDNLAADGIYDQLLLTKLSADTRLAVNLAVLCWSKRKVYTGEVSQVHAWIIENLKAEKEARGAKQFEKDVQAVLPLLRPAKQRKGQAMRMQTQFTVTQLKLLTDRKILNSPSSLLPELYLAALKYFGMPYIHPNDEERTFLNDIIRDFKMTDLLPLAAMGSQEYKCEILNRLCAMPPEERKESILDIYLSLEDAFENDRLSFLKHDKAWDFISDFIYDCIEEMKNLSFDEKLMRACIKVTGSAYRFTEKWGVAPSMNNHQQSIYVRLRGANLLRHLDKWIKTLTPFEATEVRNEIPAYYRGFLSAPMQ